MPQSVDENVTPMTEVRCPACGGTPKVNRKKNRYRIECNGDCWTCTGWRDTVSEAIAEWEENAKGGEDSNRDLIDIVQIKSAIRAGEITVYQENGCLYMENRAGERIELRPKGGEENAVD